MLQDFDEKQTLISDKGPNMEFSRTFRIGVVVALMAMLVIVLVVIILVPVIYYFIPRPLNQSPQTFNFYLIGDWGTGEPEQLNVARRMADYATMNNLDNSNSVIIDLGDHFYWQGIDNTSDPLIKKYYVDIYFKYDSLSTIPWFLCLGNHDWIKNPFAQIDYTSMNPSWTLPSTYYTKVFNASSFTVQWIFMDTSPYSELEHSRVPKIRNQNSTLQTQWLIRQLRFGMGRYDWRFVVGHHPYYSSGNYGDFGHENMSFVENLLNEYKVDGYYGGHQHILEHLQTPPYRANGHKMNFFISGAGGQMIYNHIENPHHPFSIFKMSGAGGGFMTMQLSKNSATTSVIDRNGNVAYQYILNK